MNTQDLCNTVRIDSSSHGRKGDPSRIQSGSSGSSGSSDSSGSSGSSGSSISPSASIARELELPSEALTHSIIGAGIEVHRALGPGLLEALYERAMCVELERRGIPFRSQVAIPMTYQGTPIGDYYADLVVAERVIVELKSVGMIQNAHLAQILTYLRITNLRLGLLMNFNVPVLHRGVKRVIR